MNKDITVSDNTSNNNNNNNKTNQSGIFKTEVTFNDEPYNTKNPFVLDKTNTIGHIALDVKLPNSCNFIALRETFLSQAPFVTRSNKSLWRKLLDTKQYVQMITAAFHFVSGCINENGGVNADKFKIIANSQLIQLMAVSQSEMLYNFKPIERDMFFTKLPELLTYMIINTLQTTAPKHNRVYNSYRFRDIVLDWTSELVSGIRPCNAKLHREWLYEGASDSNILITDSHNKKSKNHRNNISLGPIITSSSHRTCFLLENSPLVTAYLKLYEPNQQKFDDRSKSNVNKLTITLSHLPNRPVVTLNDKGVIGHGRDRLTKVDRLYEMKQRAEAIQHRKTLMEEFQKSKTDYSEDIIKMKNALKSTIKAIDGKTISKKEQINIEVANKLGLDKTKQKIAIDLDT